MSDATLWVAPGTELTEVVHAETAAFEAWPAKVREPVGGWICRRSPETDSRRANSVLAVDWGATEDLGAAIDRVETFYETHGGLSRFQLSPVSAPAGLDDALAARGYVVEAPVTIMAADADDVVGLEACGPPVSVARAPDARWRDVYAQATPLPGEADGRMQVAMRAADSGLDVVYATASSDDGSAAAIGLGVIVGAAGPNGGAPHSTPLALIFSMNTLNGYRRRGMGRAIIAALCREALAKGVPSVYLQVEMNNTVAIQVYESVGFRPRYAYHYRTEPRIHKVG